MSEHRSKEQHKQDIAERAGHCCEYCWSQLRFSHDPFSIEHIIPRAAGGSGDATNLAIACQGCNNRKYVSVTAVDPVTGETVPLYNPRQHRWTDHFVWNDDYTVMLGLTPTGRATIEKLQLNRVGVMNLRRVLRLVGEHPPPTLIALSQM